jgi:hypothetical protein
MAAEDLARALIRLDSDYVRHKVARGDISDFAQFGIELSDEERELLGSSSTRVPIEEEVAVGLPGEEPVEHTGQGGPGRGYGYFAPGLARAIEYVHRGLRDPSVQATFVAWQDLRGDQYP